MNILVAIAVLGAIVTGILYRVFYPKQTFDDAEMRFIPLPPIPPIPVPITPQIPIMTNQENLYQTAKSCLGRRMIVTLGVPNLLGCASSLSGVLKVAGYLGLPPQGIAGTSQLYDFFASHPEFEKTTSHERGMILIYQSNQPGAVLEHGHVFIAGDHGLMSNDSDTGIWSEKWQYGPADDYYHVYGKLTGTWFHWKG